MGPLFFKCGTNSGRMFLTGLPTNLNHAARQVPSLPEHQTDAKRNGVGLINPFTSHAPPARALPPRRRRSPSSIPPSLSDAYLDILRAVVGWLLRDCCGVSNIANYFISAVPVTSSCCSSSLIFYGLLRNGRGLISPFSAARRHAAAPAPLPLLHSFLLAPIMFTFVSPVRF